MQSNTNHTTTFYAQWQSAPPALMVGALLLLGCFFFFPFLGSVPLFDWDEVNFAESAREMALTGNYSRVQIGFEPFWEKPPLFFWMQAAAMHLFGVNEWAARFPNAVFGLITLLTLFVTGKRWQHSGFGFLWAVTYLGSILPHLYFKSGIIDPVFNYFIFLSIIGLIEAHQNPNPATRWYIFASATAGLAVLTKGPAGLLIILLTSGVVWVWRRFVWKQPIGLTFKNLFVFTTVTLLVSSVWFGIETLQNGPWFLKEFFTYQIRLLSTPDAGHAQPFFYHWVVVLVGCFPMSVWAIPAFLNRQSYRVMPHLVMICLFFVVMVLFTLVKTKIVHYSSMAYLPLSFLAASYLQGLLQGNYTLTRFVQVMLAFLGFVWALVFWTLPFVAANTAMLLPYLKDPFAVACLQTPVQWQGWEQSIALLMLAGLSAALFLLRKKTLPAVLLLYGCTAICLWVYMWAVAPKIEQYTQAPMIRFYQQMEGKNVYAEPIGFKSYAQYFYFNLPPNHRPPHYSDEWLLTGAIDKPAYLITKINRTKLVTDKAPDAQLLKTEGGFAFFERKPH